MAQTVECGYILPSSAHWRVQRADDLFTLSHHIFISICVSFSERPSHSSVICHWSLCNCIVGFYIPLKISVRGRSRLVSAVPGPWYVINPGLTLMCVSAERNRLHTDRSLFLWMTDGRGRRRQLHFSSL